MLAIVASPTPLVAQTPAPAEDCAVCPTVAARQSSEDDRQAALELCYTGVGVLSELDRRRAAFRLRPRYMDLFPTIYWNVTDIEFRRIGQGDFAHPLDKLSEIALFYDAWAANRSSWEARGEAEPHWAIHYRLAAQADADFGAIGEGSTFDTPDAARDVLDSAVSAHVDYDLPRAIRAGFDTRRDRSLILADFAADYALTDATIDRSTASAAEIYQAIRETSKWSPLVLAAGSLAWLRQIVASENATVITKRHHAWEVAMGTKPLPTGDAPQPSGDHAALAREGRAACGVPLP